jgi:leucyl-tRNA synthetase
MTTHEQIELPEQIGGKVRARVTVDTDAPSAEIERLVPVDENVTAALAGKTVKQLVVVPGRIVSIVAG